MTLSCMVGFQNYTTRQSVVYKDHAARLTLLHSERPKLYTILAFLSAIGLKIKVTVHTSAMQIGYNKNMFVTFLLNFQISLTNYKIP